MGKVICLNPLFKDIISWGKYTVQGPHNLVTCVLPKKKEEEKKLLYATGTAHWLYGTQVIIVTACIVAELVKGPSQHIELTLCV